MSGLKEIWWGAGTLQKSILFTPRDPNAGPTGGDGDAWPAPTISLTIWFVVRVLRAMFWWGRGECWYVGLQLGVYFSSLRTRLGNF